LLDWPQPYVLTAEDEAALNAPGVDDPLLREALQLQQAGIQAALSARALYERDCPAGVLANSVVEGLPLAEEAYDNLTQLQELLDEMRARP
jgi:hypothetical protein